MLSKVKFLMCFLVFAVIVVSFCFCGTVVERTVGQVHNIEADSDEDTSKKEGGEELNGEFVYEGMFPNQVTEAWGDPAYIEQAYSDGIGERWVYYGIGVKYFVEFEDDKVSKIWKE